MMGHRHAKFGRNRSINDRDLRGGGAKLHEYLFNNTNDCSVTLEQLRDGLPL